LAIQDDKRHRVVIVTVDLVGLSREVTDVVAAAVQKSYGLDRSEIVFNMSHTHSGPLVMKDFIAISDFDSATVKTLQAYSNRLTQDLIKVVGAALGDMAPATIEYGVGEAGFAMNRRQATPNGFKIGVNRSGAMDHTVPVLRIRSSNGKLRGILFGYACHNTTLTGEFYQLSGDYAGYAQAALEAAHPGTTAMFLMLCGADQNPYPRSAVEHAETHGKELAAAVDKVLGGTMTAVRGNVRAAFQTTELALAPHTREDFEKMSTDPLAPKRRLAALMLKTYDEGHPVRSITYPVQAIRIGKDFAMVTLGGEVVVDYQLRLKREYPNQKLIVAGYSNDVVSYIPTAKILQEGGYEAVDSMIYYGRPGPYTSEVEETIVSTVHRVMKRVGL
jgi:hypothetical protein